MGLPFPATPDAEMLIQEIPGREFASFINRSDLGTPIHVHGIAIEVESYHREMYRRLHTTFVRFRTGEF
jgi:hypothetical protein